MLSKQHAMSTGCHERSCDMRVYSFPHETCLQELLLLRWLSLTSNNNNMSNYSEMSLRMQPPMASFAVFSLLIAYVRPYFRTFSLNVVKQI